MTDVTNTIDSSDVENAIIKGDPTHNLYTALNLSEAKRILACVRIYNKHQNVRDLLTEAIEKVCEAQGFDDGFRNASN